MKLNRLITLLLVATLFATASYGQTQTPIDIALWPNGATEKNADEGKPCDENQQIFQPSIRVFLPEGRRTGRAVVICPGGGYYTLAYGHEGYDYASYFNHQGIALVVLKYRMPHGNHRVPLSDMCEAMRVVKAHAGEWGISPDDIGIMGFSAGGHLASTFATHYPTELKPAFQILFYPVISMDTTITHQGSRDNLIGKEPDHQLIDYYLLQRKAGEQRDTPRLHCPVGQRLWGTRRKQYPLLHGAAPASGTGLAAHLPHRRTRLGLQRIVPLQTGRSRRTGRLAAVVLNVGETPLPL